ncbi:hypothetical protein Cflav_PD5146 [Pedosphaera parvula Ellin514]|uniref:Uncharacterized protein n=1 Tax=Pedosphaera parvula (strain Ellin514) TaxID=320771 RepID=B9XC43_PEDPL|nr:hypothetical protein Cflav_PD5146 [Pedosphaera parvula Ellin514]
MKCEIRKIEAGPQFLVIAHRGAPATYFLTYEIVIGILNGCITHGCTDDGAV